MPAIKSQHSRLFEKIAVEQRNGLLESLAAGQSHDQYLLLAGQAQGLLIALRISEEADLKLSGEQ